MATQLALMTAPEKKPTPLTVPFTGRECHVRVEEFTLPGPRRRYFQTGTTAFRVVVSGHTAGLTAPRLDLGEQAIFTVVRGLIESERAARKGARRLAMRVADRLRPQLRKQGVKLTLGAELLPRANQR